MSLFPVGSCLLSAPSVQKSRSYVLIDPRGGFCPPTRVEAATRISGTLAPMVEVQVQHLCGVAVGTRSNPWLHPFVVAMPPSVSLGRNQLLPPSLGDQSSAWAPA